MGWIRYVKPQAAESAGITFGIFASFGTWTEPDSFEIIYQQIGYSNLGKWTLTFKKYGIEVVGGSVNSENKY